MTLTSESNTTYLNTKIQYDNIIGITTPCINCSFGIVAKLFSKYMKKYYNINTQILNRVSISSKVILDDIFNYLENAPLISPPSHSILWLDTAFYNTDRPISPLAKNRKIITTSKWIAAMLNDLGIQNEIIHRGIDDELAESTFELVQNKKIEKKYDFMILATDITSGHKNVQLMIKALKDLNELEKSILICPNLPCNYKPFSLSEEEKYKLYAQTRVLLFLSESEGFGLPPVEAMSVGTPVVHFDSPYVSEPYIQENNITHFPIPIYGIKPRRAGNVKHRYFPSPLYYYEDVLNVMKEALHSEVNKEELHEYVKRHFYHKVILEKLAPMVMQ